MDEKVHRQDSRLRRDSDLVQRSAEYCPGECCGRQPIIERFQGKNDEVRPERFMPSTKLRWIWTFHEPGPGDPALPEVHLVARRNLAADLRSEPAVIVSLR